MCGGEKRSAFIGIGTTDAPEVMMLYRGNGSAQIRGQVTGQIYQFPRQQPVQRVDRRDAGFLVRTRLFTRVREIGPAGRQRQAN
jgi:hypothetical protein